MNKRKENTTLKQNKVTIVFVLALSICLSEKILFAGAVLGNTSTRGFASFQGRAGRGSSSEVASFSKYSSGTDKLGLGAQSNPSMLSYDAKVNMKSPFSGFRSRPQQSPRGGQMGNYAKRASRSTSNNIAPVSKSFTKLTPSKSFKPIRSTSNIFTLNPDELGKPLSLIPMAQQSRGLAKPSVLSEGGPLQTQMDFQKQAISAYKAFTSNNNSFDQDSSNNLMTFGFGNYDTMSQSKLGFEKVKQDALRRSRGRFGLQNSMIPTR